MIAALLTLLLLFILYVGSDDSTTVVISLVLIALVWFLRMIWVDDARAYVNWTDHWSRSGKQRALDRRRWEAEASAEQDRKRAEALKRKHRKEERERKREAKREAERKVPAIKCDRCGHDVRLIHEVTYPNGTKYIEYQCPYCSERKLKKAG